MKVLSMWVGNLQKKKSSLILIREWMIIHLKGTYLPICTYHNYCITTVYTTYRYQPTERSTYLLSRAVAHDQQNCTDIGYFLVERLRSNSSASLTLRGVRVYKHPWHIQKCFCMTHYHQLTGIRSTYMIFQNVLANCLRCPKKKRKKEKEKENNKTV